jgi:hypothetical protein
MRGGAAFGGFVAAFWIWAALAAQPASAPADLSPRGQQVFKMVGQVLSEFQDSLGGSGGEINHGPVKIEEAASAVTATIPKLTLTPGKNEPAIEIGTVTLTVTEAGANRDRVAVALPDRIKFPEGSTLRIGQMRKTEMVWARELETAVGYDLDWRDLAVVDEENEVPVQIGAVRATMSLRESKPGRYTGPFSLTLSNLTATDDEEDTKIKLGSLTVATEVVDFDIKRVKALTSGKTDDPAAMFAVVQELPKLAAKMSSTVSISGLTVASVEEETSFTVDQVDLNFAFEDIDRPAARLALTYKHAGMSLEGLEDYVPEGFAPRRATLALAVEKLPLAKLADMATPPSGGAQAPPPSPEAALDLLAKAGTGIRLESLAIESETAEATADGLLTVQEGAAFGVAGGFDIRLRGLEAIIKELKELSAGQPNPVVGFVEAIRKSGHAAGGGALGYKLEVKPDGQVLLNGNELMPLIGAMSGEAPPSGGPPPGAAPKKK